MELALRIHIELLPEGLFLATSEDVQGLVVQGRTFMDPTESPFLAADDLLEEAQR